MAFECLDKQRDNSGSIRKILLRDTSNGEQRWVEKDKLKSLMNQGKINVTNLKIDSAGKLVDTESTQINERRNQSRKEDTDSDEIIKLIKSLESSSRESDNKIVKILKELYLRQQQTHLKLDELMQKQEHTSGDNIHTLSEYLQNNADKLKEVSEKLDSLTESIMNVGTASKDDENNTKDSIIKQSKFEFPEDVYEKLCYEELFMAGDNKLTGITDADTMYSEIKKLTSDCLNVDGVPMELFDKLKIEIDKAYVAYTEMRNLYLSQMNDYLGNFADNSMMSLVTGAFADRINEVPGLIGQTATGTEVLSDISMAKLTGALKDCIYTIGSMMPGLHHLAYTKQELKFASDNKLSHAQIDALKNDIEGVWNSAYRFLTQDEMWEIKLYVIQYLNKMYLDNVDATKRGFKAYRSDQGNMSVFTDATLSNKYCQQLSEVYLTGICDFMTSRKIRSKQFEAYTEAYDRIIIAYFAAKKVMYSLGMYPFDKTSTPKQNGAFLQLAAVGAMMINVHFGIVNELLTETNAPESVIKRDKKMGFPDRYKVTYVPLNEVIGGRSTE